MRAARLVLRIAQLNFVILLLSAALNALGPWLHL